MASPVEQSAPQFRPSKKMKNDTKKKPKKKNQKKIQKKNTKKKNTKKKIFFFIFLQLVFNDYPQILPIFH